VYASITWLVYFCSCLVNANCKRLIMARKSIGFFIGLGGIIQSPLISAIAIYRQLIVISAYGGIVDWGRQILQ
jgi:hypothetical protein